MYKFPLHSSTPELDLALSFAVAQHEFTDTTWSVGVKFAEEKKNRRGKLMENSRDGWSRRAFVLLGSRACAKIYDFSQFIMLIIGIHHDDFSSSSLAFCLHLAAIFSIFFFRLLLSTCSSSISTVLSVRYVSDVCRCHCVALIALFALCKWEWKFFAAI